MFLANGQLCLEHPYSQDPITRVRAIIDDRLSIPDAPARKTEFHIPASRTAQPLPSAEKSWNRGWLRRESTQELEISVPQGHKLEENSVMGPVGVLMTNLHLCDLEPRCFSAKYSEDSQL